MENSHEGPSQVHCPLCGGRELECLFNAHDRNRHATSFVFQVLVCKSCGVAFTYPQPDEALLTSLYPDTYYPTQAFSERYYNMYVRPYQKEKVDGVRRFVQEGLLLDIGCGVGLFVKEAAAAGYVARGIEWSPHAVAAGRTHWNLDIVSGDFLFHDFGRSRFDVITLWQVFEHLSLPVDALRKIHSLLNPQGLLIIAVPNFASIQAAVFRHRWYHLDVPRHLFHYTPETLSNLLERQKFKVVHQEYRSREHNWAGIFGSVFQMTPPRESVVHKLFRKSVGRYCASMLASLEARMKRGGTFVMFALRD